MKVRTLTDPTKILATYKVEEYESGVKYCYAPEKDGSFRLLAIVHNIDGGYIVDAEADVLALIPLATPTVEEPHPLYDTYIMAYGKIAKHTGIQVIGDRYFGHKVLTIKPSALSWEQLRKLEYQISAPAPDFALEAQ